MHTSPSVSMSVGRSFASVDVPSRVTSSASITPRWSRVSFRVVALSAFLAPLAHAGEHLSFHFLGTSPDGRHAAYEQYGVMDGSGSALASVHVLDTTTNEAFRPAWRHIEPENSSVGVDVVREQVRERAARELSALGIDPDRVGQRLVWHPRTDLGAEDHRVHVATRAALRGFLWREFTIELVTETLDRECFFFGDALSVDVVLHSGDGGPRLLADDFTPADLCAIGYRIEEVRLIDETSFIVVLNVLTPGFEGHSARYAVVAGRLGGPHG